MVAGGVFETLPVEHMDVTMDAVGWMAEIGATLEAEVAAEGAMLGAPDGMKECWA